MKKHIHNPRVNPHRVALPVHFGGTGAVTRDTAVAQLGLISKTEYGVANGHARVGANGKIVQSQLPDEALAKGPRLIIPANLFNNSPCELDILGCDMLTDITATSATLTLVVDKIRMKLTFVPTTATTHSITFCGKVYSVTVRSGQPKTAQIQNCWTDASGKTYVSVDEYATWGIYSDFKKLELRSLRGDTMAVIETYEYMTDQVVYELPNGMNSVFLQARYTSQRGNVGDWGDPYAIGVIDDYQQIVSSRLLDSSLSPNSLWMMEFYSALPVGYNLKVYKFDAPSGRYEFYADVPTTSSIIPVIDNDGTIHQVSLVVSGANYHRIRFYLDRNARYAKESAITTLVGVQIPSSTGAKSYITADSKYVLYTFAGVLNGASTPFYVTRFSIDTQQLEFFVGLTAAANTPFTLGSNNTSTRIYVICGNNVYLNCSRSGTALTVIGSSPYAATYLNKYSFAAMEKNLLCYFGTGNNGSFVLSDYTAAANNPVIGTAALDFGVAQHDIGRPWTNFGYFCCINESATMGAFIILGENSTYRPRLVILRIFATVVGQNTTYSASIQSSFLLRRHPNTDYNAAVNEMYRLDMRGDKLLVSCMGYSLNSNTPTENCFTSVYTLARTGRYRQVTKLLGASAADTPYSNPSAVFVHFGSRDISPSGHTVVQGCPLVPENPSNGRIIINTRPGVGRTHETFVHDTGTAANQAMKGLSVKFYNEDILFYTAREAADGTSRSTLCAYHRTSPGENRWNNAGFIRYLGVSVANRTRSGPVTHFGDDGLCLSGPHFTAAGQAAGKFVMELCRFKASLNLNGTFSASEDYITGTTVYRQIELSSTTDLSRPEFGCRSAASDDMRWLAMTTALTTNFHTSLWDLENPTTPPVDLYALVPAEVRAMYTLITANYMYNDVQMSRDGRVIALGVYRVCEVNTTVTVGFTAIFERQLDNSIKFKQWISHKEFQPTSGMGSSPPATSRYISLNADGSLLGITCALRPAIYQRSPSGNYDLIALPDSGRALGADPEVSQSGPIVFNEKADEFFELGSTQNSSTERNKISTYARR